MVVGEGEPEPFLDGVEFSGGQAGRRGRTTVAAGRGDQAVGGTLAEHGGIDRCHDREHVA